VVAGLFSGRKSANFFDVSVTEPSSLLTVEEVATRFNVTPRTVYNWASNGALPTVRVGRGFLRFPKADIERILNGNGMLHASEADPA
jgi:excisionase family DNA binding protein